MQSLPTLHASGHLPRLLDVAYQDRAVVFWTHTVANRRVGWLGAEFHGYFREVMLHAAVREGLLCPIYTLMPDHLHLMWMGVCERSDQRRAAGFLRRELTPRLRPHKWQHQPHDRVLRKEDRRRRAFATACTYIAENPVRAKLAEAPANWPFTGCIVPGYPDLHPLRIGFWEKFWRFYGAAAEAGAVGKLEHLRPAP